jgi:iron(III) transport system ATP-binding protein
MTTGHPRQVGRDQQKPYLRITNVTKKFGDFTALKDINLDIYEGEFVCFVGPSGCGKTTLLRAIAGLDVQTYGTIKQAGEDISSLPPSERDFGIVFQSYALFPNMTVFKNIAYGLENKKMSKPQIRERVRELLALVGLSDQEKKYPAQLSGGQQQRVAFARALATSPGLLLLDEPLSALDAKVRGHLRQEMKDLQTKLGVTTIMVTHDQEEALTMGDRILVMSHGIIEQVGTPNEIYHHPSSVFVADFIGTMNFMKGTLMDDNVVKVGDFHIKATANGRGGSKGSEVTLAIRPEAIRFENGEQAANTLEAEIGRLEFLGSIYRTDLHPKGDKNMALRADMPAHQYHALDLGVGKHVHITLPEPSIKIFAA